MSDAHAHGHADIDTINHAHLNCYCDTRDAHTHRLPDGSAYGHTHEHAKPCAHADALPSHWRFHRPGSGGTADQR